MKTALTESKKKKYYSIITVIVLLLFICSFVSCGINSEDEISTITSSPEVTKKIKTTTTETTAKPTTTKATTKTTTTEATTKPTTTETTTKPTTTETTTETTTKPTTTETTTETTTKPTTTETITETETTTKPTTTEKAVEIVECPDLSGINYDEAIKMYSAYITIKKDSEEHNSYISAGNIIEQDIKFPSKVEKGTVVKVKVSLGPVAVQTTPPQAVQPAQQVSKTYVLNTDTNCIHANPQCSAAQKIIPENYSEVVISESELSNYTNIYWACGKCCSYNEKNTLPKF
ncbi:MAG: PASTA domain-containing protein [Ruminococcus sp.]|nr:PASTA domain-containing protein [Ruminococcus sp.]